MTTPLALSFTVPGTPQGKGRGSMAKATNTQIADAYRLAGSCKGAAVMLGMCAQSVHERLQRAGLNRPVNIFTDAEKGRLAREYETHASAETLAELAAAMGRTKPFICRQARELGLTDSARPRPYGADRRRAATKKWIAANGHPRGMAGKTHSAAARAAIGLKSTQRWACMDVDQRADFVMAQMKAKVAVGRSVAPRSGTTWKSGWREVGGRRIYFRSRWEANYGRYLEWLRSRGHIISWDHEPETFWFEKIKRGCRSYLPDFRIVENDGRVVFHEVKGWMDDRSKTKINRMRIYHPTVTLVVIAEKQYSEIRRKLSSMIVGWES